MFMSTIKHLVIAGGGQTLMQSLGAICYLDQQKFLSLNQIESIYGTSAGAILAAMLALKFEWDTLNDFILKRPWHKTFPISIHQCLEAYSKKGFFDETAFRKVFKPLFDAKDISLDITLKEFYELTHVNLHIFTFEVMTFEKVELSHVSYPDLSLIKALHMSSALPIVFDPVFMDGKCYIDGGLNCNYPLEDCLNKGVNEDEVVGFCNEYKKDEKSQIDEDSNIINFIVSFFFKMVGAFSTDKRQKKIANEVRYEADAINVDILMDALYSFESRQLLFKSGEDAAKQFLLSKL